jgi:hypothetical protein
MVKAGVFLLARLHPALAGSDLFFYTVSGIGAITLLIGAWNAIFQHDLKGLLECDGLAILPGWEFSTGARNEVTVAGVLRMPVKSVAEWLEYKTS